jgi:hypothetical protein
MDGADSERKRLGSPRQDDSALSAHTLTHSNYSNGRSPYVEGWRGFPSDAPGSPPREKLKPFLHCFDIDFLYTALLSGLPSLMQESCQSHLQWEFDGFNQCAHGF